MNAEESCAGGPGDRRGKKHRQMQLLTLGGACLEPPSKCGQRPEVTCSVGTASGPPGQPAQGRESRRGKKDLITSVQALRRLPHLMEAYKKQEKQHCQ